MLLEKCHQDARKAFSGGLSPGMLRPLARIGRAADRMTENRNEISKYLEKVVHKV